MSRTVDQRVVEMQFDNRNFESNVKQSLSTIDKLKQSLDFTKSGESLNNLNKPTVLSGFTSAVESVQMKFSALEVAAITALSNIVNKAVNAGLRIANALTVQPITQGYNEYELKLGSIQTIMMSTGASMETVNRYLEELNTYADKTIYSFSDMTSNIGKFTNAGVSLDMAVKAIQGVANVAAVSGANAQQASHAMYNFAQALSAGYVKLIDWKSIENANMATVEFKQQLIDTAVQLGKLEKQADGTYKVIGKNAMGASMKEAMSATKNFNDSLSYQWMTTEVLTRTLAKYTDETTEIGKKAYSAATEVRKFTQLMDTLGEAVGSGWAQTFEIIFGNFEETTKLWTNVSNEIGDIINKISDARNEIFLVWKALGGRDDLLATFRNIWEYAKGTASSIGEVFNNIFPKEKSFTKFKDEYVELLDTLKDHSDSENILERTRDYFTSDEWQSIEHFGMATDKYKQSLIDTAVELGKLEKLEDGRYKTVYDEQRKILSQVFDAQSLFDGKGLRTQWLTEGVINAASTTNVLLDAYLKLYDVSDHLGQKLASIFKSFREFTDLFNISKYPDKIKSIDEEISKIITTIKDLKRNGDPAGMIGVLEEKLQKLLEKKKYYTSIFDQLTRIGENFKVLFTGVFSVIKSIGTVFSNFFGSISPLFGDFAPTLLNVFEIISSIAAKIGTVLTNLSEWILGSKALTFTINSLSSALDFLITFVTSLIDKVKEFVTSNDLLVKLSEGFTKVKDALSGFWSSVTESISSNGISAIVTGFNNITTSILNFVKKIVEAGLLVSFGASIKGILGNLSGFTESLKSLSIGSLKDNLSGIFDTFKDFLSSITQKTPSKELMMIAIAVGVLAASLALLSVIDPYGLARGLGALIVIFIALKKSMENLASIKMDKKSSSLTKVAAAMIPFSIAILLLSSALAKLGKLEPEQLILGTLALSAIIAVLLGVAKTLSSTNSTKMTKGISSLIAFAIAINLLVIPIKQFASMDKSMLAKGIIAVTAILGILTGFTAILSLIKGKFANSLSTAPILILVGALAAVSLVVKILGSMDTNVLLKGGGALTVFLGVIIGALALLSKVGVGKALGGSASLVLLAAALTLLVIPLKILSGMDMEKVGNAFLILVGALGLLHVAAIFMGPIIPAMIGLAGAIALLGVACLAVGGGLLAFSAGLSALSVSGVAAVDGLIVMIEAIVDAIIKAIPKILESIIDGIGIIISSVLRNISQFVVDLGPLIDTVLQLVTERGPALIESVLSIINTLLQNLTTYAPMYGEAAIGIVAGFINGFANGLDTYGPQLTEAIDNLIWSLIATICNLLGMDINGGEAAEMAEIGMGTILGFINGIGSKAQEVWQAGVNIIQGLWDGLKSKVEDIWNWCKDLASSIVSVFTTEFDEHSPSKVFEKIGMNVDIGLANGIANYADAVELSANKTANSAINSMSRAIATIPDLLDDNIDYEPTIRPIMDLSDIQNGASAIGSMMSGYSITGRYNLPRNNSVNVDVPVSAGSRPVANITLNAKTINRAEVDYLMNRANNVLLESAISFKG